LDLSGSEIQVSYFCGGPVEVSTVPGIPCNKCRSGSQPVGEQRSLFGAVLKQFKGDMFCAMSSIWPNFFLQKSFR